MAQTLCLEPQRLAAQLHLPGKGACVMWRALHISDPAIEAQHGQCKGLGVVLRHIELPSWQSEKAAALMSACLHDAGTGAGGCCPPAAGGSAGRALLPRPAAACCCCACCCSLRPGGGPGCYGVAAPPPLSASGQVGLHITYTAHSAGESQELCSQRTSLTLHHLT